MGLIGRVLQSLKALYTNVNCSVRINGYLTDWFPVLSGLKQGCLLSPLLFNLFANDLGEAIDATGLGIDINGVTGKLNMLLYADDFALIADTEEDLQKLLNALSKWCKANEMPINIDKTKVVHFQNPVLFSVSLVETKQLMLLLHLDILVLLLTNI